MNLDIHTHGKLAKKLPFSQEYTKWLFQQAKNSNLDAICLTEHFNTLEFDSLYNFISHICKKDNDTFIYDNLKIFCGMEIDIKESGHILAISDIETILKLNKKLKPNMNKDNFLTFENLISLLKSYNIIIGAAHPYRKGSNIPSLPLKLLNQLDFIDLNGKDIALNKDYTINKTKELSEKLNINYIAGSDTHQATQYGCIYNSIFDDINTIEQLKYSIKNNKYSINISESIDIQVESATLLKKCLKKIYSMGGNYVEVLVSPR